MAFKKALDSSECCLCMVDPKGAVHPSAWEETLVLPTDQAVMGGAHWGALR